MQFDKDCVVIGKVIATASVYRKKMLTLYGYNRDLLHWVNVARYVLGADTESLVQDILCYMAYICDLRGVYFPESLLSCGDINILLSSDILKDSSDFVDYVRDMCDISHKTDPREYLSVLRDLASSGEICVNTVNSLDYNEDSVRVLSKIKSLELYCSICTKVAAKLLSDEERAKSSTKTDVVTDGREENELDQEDFLHMIEYINDARQVNGRQCYIPKGGDMLQELKEAAGGVTVDMIEPILETFKPAGSEEIRRIAANTVPAFPKKNIGFMREIVEKAPTTEQTGNRIRDSKTKAINDVVYLMHYLRPGLDLVGDYTKYFSYSSHPHIALAPIISFAARCLSESLEEEFLYYCYTRGLAVPNNIGERSSEDVDFYEAVRLIKKFFKIYSNSDVTGDQEKAWEQVLEISFYLYIGDYEGVDELIDYFKQDYYEI